MENPKKIISSNNPQTDTQPLEHSEPQAIHAQTIPFISEEFTKHYLTICNQGLFGAVDDSTIGWLASTVHNIKAGNYDALLPNDLSEIKQGAILLYDDLTGKPEWAIADESKFLTDEDMSLTDEDKLFVGEDMPLTDDDRRNYVIHVAVPTFIEDLTYFCFIPAIRPSQLDSIAPAKMAALSIITNDLRDIVRQNADPTIPFEQRLDGNRDLQSRTLRQPLHCTPAHISTTTNPT